MEINKKTPILKTLGQDYANPFNQLTPPTALSNGQPGVIQHAGLTKREYFAVKIMSALLQNSFYINAIQKGNNENEIDLSVKISKVAIELTNDFIEQLNEPE